LSAGSRGHADRRRRRRRGCARSVVPGEDLAAAAPEKVQRRPLDVFARRLGAPASEVPGAALVWRGVAIPRSGSRRPAPAPARLTVCWRPGQRRSLVVAHVSSPPVSEARVALCGGPGPAASTVSFRCRGSLAVSAHSRRQTVLVGARRLDRCRTAHDLGCGSAADPVTLSTAHRTPALRAHCAARSLAAPRQLLQAVKELCCPRQEGAAG
jgi:hypothetical protein